MASRASLVTAYWDNVCNRGTYYTVKNAMETRRKVTNLHTGEMIMSVDSFKGNSKTVIKNELCPQRANSSIISIMHTKLNNLLNNHKLSFGQTLYLFSLLKEYGYCPYRIAIFPFAIIIDSGRTARHVFDYFQYLIIPFLYSTTSHNISLIYFSTPHVAS